MDTYKFAYKCRNCGEITIVDLGFGTEAPELVDHFTIIPTSSHQKIGEPCRYCGCRSYEKMGKPRYNTGDRLKL